MSELPETFPGEPCAGPVATAKFQMTIGDPVYDSPFSSRIPCNVEVPHHNRRRIGLPLEQLSGDQVVDEFLGNRPVKWELHRSFRRLEVTQLVGELVNRRPV